MQLDRLASFTAALDTKGCMEHSSPEYNSMAHSSAGYYVMVYSGARYHNTVYTSTEALDRTALFTAALVNAARFKGTASFHSIIHSNTRCHSTKLLHNIASYVAQLL
jgi:hypothetical protein